jgi:hypothetical protein
MKNNETKSKHEQKSDCFRYALAHRPTYLTKLSEKIYILCYILRLVK